MKTRFVHTFTAVSLLAATMLFGVSTAVADEHEDAAETTIRLMGAAEASLPDAVTRDIVLPDKAAVDVEAVRGLEKAAERNKRRDNGLDTADAARNNAADLADEARSNRESRGRSDDIPDRPDRPDRPEPPGRPDGS